MAAGRNRSIDALRLLGAVGIVVFHLGVPGAWIGYAALPMFIALSGAFTAGPSQARARAIQLLLIWLAWSVAYAVLKVAQAVLKGNPVGSEFEHWMWTTGPTLHLWFLPYMAVGILVAGAIRERAGAGGLAWTGLALCAAGVAVLTVFGLPGSTPWAQWLFGLPAMGAGFVLSAWRAGAAPFIVVALLGLLAAASYMLPVGFGMAQTLIAVVALLVAFRLPSLVPHWATLASPLALGIYLVHPAIIAVLLQGPLSREDLSSPIGAATVVALSWGGVRLAARHPVIRPYVAA